MLFERGPLFYAFLNLRLFFFLFVKRANLFISNDLDTLPAVWLASSLRKIPCVFDSHEYFTEVPELVDRPRIQKIWKRIERFLVPRISNMLTVNQAIADLFEREYPVSVQVLMNLPPAKKEKREIPVGQLPEGFKNKTLILYQGAVNRGRGLAEIIAAMEFLPQHALLIIGGGDLLPELQDRVANLSYKDQIYFTGRLPMEDLEWYTAQAAIGLSLEQDLGLNYRLALPNKIFDYMKAGLPVLASDHPVMGEMVRSVNFGLLINRFEPEYLAARVLEMTSDSDRYQLWKAAAQEAFPRFTWESQESVLIRLCAQAMQS